MIPEFLNAELATALRREASGSAYWQSAGIGIEGNIETIIRRDQTHWLTGESGLQQRYLAGMEALRQAINRHFFAGLFEFECHFAHYAPGAYYRKHLDAIKGRNARVLTSVCYLNPDWSPADGGELLLYDENSEHMVERIQLRNGNMVLFWSERFPHEVLPAKTDRYSIAGWFRRNMEPANPL